MASRSINKVTLIGNLTRDPELKYTPSGTAVCTFGVATNRSWTTADGETREDVQFHRIVAWQKLAELCAKILSKGRKVFLEGRIIYRSYVGKDGQQRQITEIIMDDFVVFDDRRKYEEGATGQSSASTVSTSSANNESTAPSEEDLTIQTVDAPEEPKETDESPEAPKEDKVDESDIPF